MDTQALVKFSHDLSHTELLSEKRFWQSLKKKVIEKVTLILWLDYEKNEMGA